MESCFAEGCLSGSTETPAGQIFVQLIQSILSAQCALVDNSIYPADRISEVLVDPEFDFIVVGAGTAGSVVASRLSENKEWKVLLIERGKDPSIGAKIPSMFMSVLGTEEDYSYKTEPDSRFCRGAKGNKCVWPRGKVLGGTSAINSMLHNHGNQKDFDLWSEMGNIGWSFEEVLPYFRKSENYLPEVAKKLGKKYLGVDGPLKIRKSNYAMPELLDTMISAGRELGYPKVETFNAERNIGFGYIHGAIDEGLRQDAARAFLGPAKNRPNLFVIKSTRADSVIVQNKKAVGIRVTLNNGKKLKLRTRKEIILSAGTVASPQILMLSGIGPKKHLHDIGIQPIMDLPVGNNLQDHVKFPVPFAFPNSTRQYSGMLDAAYQYAAGKKGPLSVLPNSISFVNVDHLKAEYPNVALTFSPIRRGNSEAINFFINGYAINDEIRSQMQNINKLMDIVVAAPVLLNPKSVGKIRLRSNNPQDQVKIYPNYFDDKDDVRVLIKGVNVFRRMEETSVLKKLGVTLKMLQLNSCSHTVTGSDEYWECYMRNVGASSFHPVGTVKMGPFGDETAVVNAELKVYGIDNLRVIDASIMPAVTSANTNSPTMMIAEKGSDMIKLQWMV